MAPHYNSGSTADTFASLRRHGEYYLTGGDLFVLVTPIHFRVHRYFFERESEYFQKKLAGPSGARPGSSESTAIMVDDVTPDEFAKFLWVFYNPRYSMYEANLEDWKQILDLANRWTFPEVKALCIRELQKPRIVMQDLEKICLYHKYSIDRNFLIPHYIAIVLRAAPPSLEEGNDMGMETTVATYTARERQRGGRITGSALENLVRDLYKVPDATPETQEYATPGSPTLLFNALAEKNAAQTNGDTTTADTSTFTPSEPPKESTDATAGAFDGDDKDEFGTEGKGIYGSAGADDAGLHSRNGSLAGRGKPGSRRGGTGRMGNLP